MEYKIRTKEEQQEWIELYTIRNRYPFTLEEIKKWKEKKGIYALMHNNSVIYVGQSINLGSRLQSHRNENALNNIVRKTIKEGGRNNNSKAIAMYGFINEHREEIKFAILKETEDLDVWEEKYITHFKPRFNYKGVDVPYYSMEGEKTMTKLLELEAAALAAEDALLAQEIELEISEN